MVRMDSIDSIINWIWGALAIPLYHLYSRLGKLDERAQEESTRLHNRINRARDDMTASELRILREHATKSELENGFAKMDKTITLLREDQKSTSDSIAAALQRIEDKLERKQDKGTDNQ